MYFKAVVADHLFRYWEDHELLANTAIIGYGILVLLGAWASRKQPLYIWTILIYGLIILVYPYRYSGFRFILPIHGIVLALAAMGIYRIIPKLLNKKWLMILVVGAYLGTHMEWWKTIINQQDVILAGPQHPDSQALFFFLDNETKPTEPILFIKPRVLSLYGKRASVSNEPHGTQEEIRELIRQNSIKGVILCEDVPHPSLKQYVAEYQEGFSLKYENRKFRYYSVTDTPTPHKH